MLQELFEAGRWEAGLRVCENGMANEILAEHVVFVQPHSLEEKMVREIPLSCSFEVFDE
jgi:hypothetical protein